MPNPLVPAAAEEGAQKQALPAMGPLAPVNGIELRDNHGGRNNIRNSVQPAAPPADNHEVVENKKQVQHSIRVANNLPRDSPPTYDKNPQTTARKTAATARKGHPQQRDNDVDMRSSNTPANRPVRANRADPGGFGNKPLFYPNDQRNNVNAGANAEIPRHQHNHNAGGAASRQGRPHPDNDEKRVNANVANRATKRDPSPVQRPTKRQRAEAPVAPPPQMPAARQAAPALVGGPVVKKNNDNPKWDYIEDLPPLASQFGVKVTNLVRSGDDEKLHILLVNKPKGIYLHYMYEMDTVVSGTSIYNRARRHGFSTVTGALFRPDGTELKDSDDVSLEDREGWAVLLKYREWTADEKRQIAKVKKEEKAIAAVRGYSKKKSQGKGRK